MEVHEREPDECRPNALLRFLIRARWFVLSFWLLGLGVALPFAPKLIRAARFTLEPVEGTPSYDARRRIDVDFPFLSYQDSEAIVISCPTCDPKSGGVLAPPSSLSADQMSPGDFTRRVIGVFDDKLGNLSRDHQDLNMSWMSALGSSQGRVSITGLGDHNPFVAPDNRSTILQLTWSVSPHKQNIALSIFSDLQDTMSNLKEEAKSHGLDFDILLTGPLALFEATLKSTEQDLTTKDAAVLPIALLILGWRVRSWRLALLTLLNVGITAAISFFCFLPIATYAVDISPLAPPIMIFLSIAFSIDYSLFLFTRWSEEISKGRSAVAALQPMIARGGEVVCLSGGILILCYLAVLLFPGRSISSIGLGASITIFFAIASNLTVSPCAIAAFPHFFGSGVGRCCRNADKREQRFWFRWASVVTSRFCLVLAPLAAYAVLIPLGLMMLRYKENFDNSLTFPREGPTTEAYQILQRSMPAGYLSPIFIFQRGEVESDAWFEANRGLAQQVWSSTSETAYELASQDFIGLSVLPDPTDKQRWINVTWSPAAAQNMTGAISALELLKGNATVCSIRKQLCEAYAELWRQYSNPDNTSGILRISPQFDPYSATMLQFLDALRAALGRRSMATAEEPQLNTMATDIFLRRRSEPLVDLSMAGFSDTSRLGTSTVEQGVAGEAMLFSPLIVIFDVMRVIYKRLPFILLAVFLSSFMCVALVFKAAFAPLKLFLTVVVPLCMVYGVAVLVYQDGPLDFLGWQAVHSTGGLYWATPVFTTTILIGLALDYDIFLFARVVELRSQGFENRVAVVGAITFTGPTISAAGLIMATGFGGLLLTDVPANNQIGFLMVFAVLVDTFIIRTCLVPAMLVLWSGINYWPRRLPPGIRGFDDLQKLLDQQHEEHQERQDESRPEEAEDRPESDISLQRSS